MNKTEPVLIEVKDDFLSIVAQAIRAVCVEADECMNDSDTYDAQRLEDAICKAERLSYSIDRIRCESYEKRFKNDNNI